MKATLHLSSGDVTVDLGAAIDISIRLDFGATTPEAFGIPAAEAHPLRAGDFVGAVAQGGPVNCFVVTTTPHGNGTHTECVGHVVRERVGVADILEDELTVGQLVSVPVAPLGDSGESYEPGSDDDLVITRAALEAAGAPPCATLLIRTLPNDVGGPGKACWGAVPPYLTQDAMALVRELGVKHLLVDVPSVDREVDEGHLLNHRMFWDLPPGAVEFESVPSPRTITEMIYVPDDVSDGRYAVSIQIPPWVLDAAPSRVRLYRLEA